ncbi:CAAX protease self-immunity [Leptospira ryugenii]|uniref:CAAX protease self-immunity n=1 Tax=Leptospira ryugenii TaxID=1917863 RepID=A0A2P2E3G1_9LEPT|nr:CPBP family intramembrane glutamic endopeptidase [Leptospira ryugenii]GBF51443.1 CAAX protease self-immunity [Leptospira ryugenii]
MNSRFFEIFRLTTFALGMIFIANFTFTLIYQQFIHSVNLNDRIPEELTESLNEDAANPDVSFKESFSKVRKAIEGIENEYLAEVKANPEKSFERFYDIMLKDKLYFLFLQSLFWGLSYVGLAYLILKKILKYDLCDLSDELSFQNLSTGIKNGLLIFFIILLVGVLIKSLGIEANPGLFPAKLFHELQGNANLLAWSIYTVGIMTGILEELFFRGYLLKSFIDKGYGQEGLLIISLLFGFLHFGIGTSVVVPFLITFVGLFFGFLYLKHKNIWVPIACHATYNSLGLLIAYFRGESL